VSAPAFTINGLNPLALRIAMFLHGASGLVRMETIRAVATTLKMSELLPQALQQLQENKQAEVCPWCDALVASCEDQWCQLHAGNVWRTRHTPDCPRAGKMPSKEVVTGNRRRVG
jgi:hypothetical protein